MKKTSIIKILTLLFFLIFMLYSYGQKSLKEANIALDKEQYGKAIKLYNAQIKKSKNKKNIQSESYFKIAYCYKKLSLPFEAAENFSKAIKLGYSDPIIHLYYGEALQMLQKYDTALIHYELFKELDPKHKLSNKGVESIDFTFASLKDPTRHKVELFAVLNSGEHDYCPFYEVKNKHKIYFTSGRYAPTHISISPESGEYCSNLFYSEQDKFGKWGTPVIVPGLVNTTDEEGAACLNHKSSNLYFTRCQYDKHKDRGCRIYVAKRVGSYWGQIKEVEIPGIPDNISIGHPAISDDELCLYFVADSLLGGMGGKDIYKVVRERKNTPFSPPQNLGPFVNTEADEVHPYIRSNGDLYFSSDGHPGMGGFDIFKAKHISGTQYNISNLGYPINSTQDDFGIVFIGMKEEGFLSSTRTGGVGKFDLYHFVLPSIEFTVNGTVYDNYTKDRIANVDIQVMNDEYILMDSQSSDSNGDYEIDLLPENNYIIFYKHNGYQVGKEQVNTKDLKYSKQFIRDVYLQK